MTLKSDRKFEEKLTLNSKNDMRNLMNFNAGSEVRKICTLMCYFCRKYIMFEPKKYRGIMCHNTEEWCKYVSSLDYHPRSSKLASRIHLFIFTWTPQGFISVCLSVCLPVSFCSSVCLSLCLCLSLALFVQNPCWIFSLKLLYATMCGKNFQIYGVHIPRKCIDSRHFYLYHSPFKTRPQLLVITP